MLSYPKYHHRASVYPFLLHCFGLRNLNLLLKYILFFTLLSSTLYEHYVMKNNLKIMMSYAQYQYVAEVSSVLLHCWWIPNLKHCWHFSFFFTLLTCPPSYHHVAPLSFLKDSRIFSNGTHCSGASCRNTLLSFPQNQDIVEVYPTSLYAEEYPNLTPYRDKINFNRTLG